MSRQDAPAPSVHFPNDSRLDVAATEHRLALLRNWCSGSTATAIVMGGLLPFAVAWHVRYSDRSPRRRSSRRSLPSARTSPVASGWQEWRSRRNSSSCQTLPPSVGGCKARAPAGRWPLGSDEQRPRSSRPAGSTPASPRRSSRTNPGRTIRTRRRPRRNANTRSSIRRPDTRAAD